MAAAAADSVVSLMASLATLLVRFVSICESLLCNCGAVHYKHCSILAVEYLVPVVSE